jgi:CubicO group peptidase (beta-lactamase class C family)
VEALTTSHVPVPEPDPLYQGGYGYGVHVGKLEGHRLVWHTGGVPGFTSFLGFYPDDQLTLVMLSNLETPLDGLAHDLVRMMLQDGGLYSRDSGLHDRASSCLKPHPAGSVHHVA